jgi:hypothetical protein
MIGMLNCLNLLSFWLFSVNHETVVLANLRLIELFGTNQQAS